MSSQAPPTWPAGLADGPLQPWFEQVIDAVPGHELFDAHTHLGMNDPDGFKLGPSDLRAGLERAHARGVVFPMQEPDGYPPANDYVLREAEASGGRLVAFCRLDPAADPLAEAERCLEAGARGIKLHPRAERFVLADPRLEGVFALADERRLPVLVHAGRGIPALGRHAVELAERYPGLRLILAHAAISDLSWIWGEAEDLPNLFFDTSWWRAADLIALFALVPPGQIVWGSDAPYGTPTVGACIGLRCAQQVGVEGEALRAVAGGTIAALIAGEDPPDLGPAVGTDRVDADVLLARVEASLITGIGRMITGGEGGEESVQLARQACEVERGTRAAPASASVLSLLDLHDAVRAEHGDENPRLGLAFLIVASIVARTPDVPLPTT
jgi:predicted TIM-barrel fold metal-dependent hydrolase